MKAEYLRMRKELADITTTRDLVNDEIRECYRMERIHSQTIAQLRKERSLLARQILAAQHTYITIEPDSMATIKAWAEEE